MNEYQSLQAGEYQVWLTREPTRVQAIPEAEFVHKAANHEFRLRVAQLGLQRGEHARGLIGVGSVVHVQLALRSGDAQLVEEDAAELVVVVLTGVNEHLFIGFAQFAGNGRGLHELRPISDDRGYQHGVTENGSAGVHLEARWSS